MERDSLPLDFHAFNRFHHGGKVREQDIQAMKHSISAFFGPAAYFLERGNFLRSFTLRRFLIGMAVLVTAEVALEIVSVRAGVWLYFGDQPFTVGISRSMSRWSLVAPASCWGRLRGFGSTG